MVITPLSTQTAHTTPIPATIVIAADSFKECLTAPAVCSAIAKGVRRALPTATIIEKPMADGGEGTTAVMVAATGGRTVTANVENALGEIITASYGILPDGTAVIEMAAAAGLDLIAECRRDIRRASTYGVGQLMNHALVHGATHFIIGLGGSATNDGGAGMLQALGVKLLDVDGHALPRGGAALIHLHHIDTRTLPPRWKEATITIASDVNNPLTGERGASAIFGPQKGADPATVAELDRALAHFAERCRAHHLPNHEHSAGTGAAGGTGFALLTFFNAHIQSGVATVIDTIDLKTALKTADLVITGEGKIDGQTSSGKVPYGVLQAAQAANVPCIALCGALGQNLEAIRQLGFTAVFPTITHVEPLSDVLKHAETNLTFTAEQAVRLFMP